MIRRLRFAQLDPDAPPVPAGLRPKFGVEYGCGSADCTQCYEPMCAVSLSVFHESDICIRPAGHDGPHQRAAKGRS